MFDAKCFCIEIREKKELNKKYRIGKVLFDCSFVYIIRSNYLEINVKKNFNHGSYQIEIFKCIQQRFVTPPLKSSTGTCVISPCANVRLLICTSSLFFLNRIVSIAICTKVTLS